MTLSSIDSRILKSLPLVKKKEPSKTICKIFFDNKTIEKTNLSCSFHHLLVNTNK